jgi:Mn2+/Fe2+ NRAMP family transporter
LAATGAFYLAAHAPIWTFGVALFTSSVFWVVYTGLAFLTATQRKLKAHREWMILSYLATFGFVYFRIVMNIVGPMQLGDIKEVLTTVAWLTNVVPTFTAFIIMRLPAKA